MKSETLDAVITIRCTVADKEAISESAWKARSTVSKLFYPYIKKLAKESKKGA